MFSKYLRRKKSSLGLYIRRNIFASAMPKVSLDKEFPMTDQIFESKSKIAEFKNEEPKIATLANGLKVVTKDCPEPLASVALAYKSGSHLESPEFYGQSSFLEKMAFKASIDTTSFSIAQQLEAMGAQISTELEREMTIIKVDVLKKFVPSVLGLMADCLLQPAFYTHEINNAKFDYKNFLDEVTSETRTEELMHLAAYGMKGRGLPLFASPESLDRINNQTLTELHRRLVRPENLTLSAVGVKEEEFLFCAAEFFGSFVTSDGSSLSKEACQIGKASQSVDQKSEKSLGNQGAEIANEDKYIGGEVRKFDEDRHKETFFTVAFPIEGWQDKTLPAVSVLYNLLGGGNSFSVGGPGKGMHSRLYERVLNGVAATNSCSTVVYFGEHKGLFGITGSASFANARRISTSILDETKNIVNKKLLTNEAFERAKNRTLSSFLMNIESRRILVSDYAKQVLFAGKTYSVDELKSMIQSVTKDDLLKVGSEMLKQKPAVVTEGNTMDVPNYNEIEGWFK